MVEPDQRHRASRDQMDQALSHGYCGMNLFLDPQSQPIKTPGGCPSHQRPKRHAIEEPAHESKANRVVVAGDEADGFPVDGRKVRQYPDPVRIRLLGSSDQNLSALDRIPSGESCEPTDSPSPRIFSPKPMRVLVKKSLRLRLIRRGRYSICVNRRSHCS